MVSDTFAITNGVKQGCVLAPTLFSIFLLAMLRETFKDKTDGIYIQSRQNADLFTIAHFRAKTKNTNILVRELLFADDSALIAHSAEEIQRIVDAFANASCITMYLIKQRIRAHLFVNFALYKNT